MKICNSQYTVHYIITLSTIVFKMKECIGQINKNGPLMRFWSRKNGPLTRFWSRKMDHDEFLVQKSHKCFWVTGNNNIFC